MLLQLPPKALKMRATKDTMALVANSIGGRKCTSARENIWQFAPGTDINSGFNADLRQQLYMLGYLTTLA